MGNGQGNNSNNNQSVKVVIPPRPDRRRKQEPECVQNDTQPVRVQIPPRHGRKVTPAPQPQQTPPHRVETPPAASGPVRIQMPQRVQAAQNSRGADNRVRTEMSYEQLAQLASSVVMIMIHDNSGQPFASGSGIMIGRKGYILTNNHVLSEGKFFTVRIENDDKCYKTEQVIKYNQLLDLAVIRIDRELAPLPIYKGPQKLVRGQKVVAIGSPRGLFNSVSDGIISGFRKLDDVDMIQFTAPISQGSSGGAVLNMYGEVIGISTLEMIDAQNLNMAVGYEFINLFTQGFVN
ncbi:MAG: serine protease [Lachnospiraceae bacterium]|nr:serine protease [Lachnospiraceae bacterium]